MGRMISEVYDKGSVGAKRCEAIVNAIVSDIAGLEPEASEEHGFKEYQTYSDRDGWLTVTTFPKKDGRRAYFVMRRDNKCHRATSLDIYIADNGRHSAIAYTWEV